MNALNSAMLVLVLINVVSVSYGYNNGRGVWTQWREVSTTPCDSLCGGGTSTVRRERFCIGGWICYPGEDVATSTRSCNWHSCDNVCPKGAVSNIPNPNSDTSYYHCANKRAVLRDCPEKTTFSPSTGSCK